MNLHLNNRKVVVAKLFDLNYKNFSKNLRDILKIYK